MFSVSPETISFPIGEDHRVHPAEYYLSGNGRRASAATTWAVVHTGLVAYAGCSGSSRSGAGGAAGSGRPASPGFFPAATNAWIAHAVEGASEPRSGVSSKPPSLFWSRRRNASPRVIVFAPFETPAARSAWIAAAVSFESAWPLAYHDQPPLFGLPRA